MVISFIYILGNILIGLGCLFVLSSIAGFVKFRDPFKMMHVGGVADLAGMPLIILGCGIIFITRGNYDAFFKILFIIIITYITSPIGTNAISESASRMYGYQFLKNKDDNSDSKE
ncbi:monovalent cation/H(+) antiporter subunit G [Candidatus Deianiraea vastatrix]|uniref:Monovalent cation/proton antiporter, MnhG/PhaG subunit family n=1 Tax=Candidatus Deianiraea vastatrix TaxID=2163644 RepID=A0A5B8XDY5_9RICK|nr:monovalent cation/H(+) antiporter subunit G [Candidatus Deianiraea vastatrix]QED23440.1 Putative monovalent cation/proton antiporter, MnhG/PhaG subunit family [Candidatus Deianiraea vastatrix]